MMTTLRDGTQTNGRRGTHTSDVASGTRNSPLEPVHPLVRGTASCGLAFGPFCAIRVHDTAAMEHVRDCALVVVPD